MLSCGIRREFDKSKRGNQVEFSICCGKGKVQLSLLQKPPQLLTSLLSGEDHSSRNFLQNIRLFNE